MNQTFCRTLLTRSRFRPEAQAFFGEVLDALRADGREREIDRLVQVYHDSGFDTAAMNEAIAAAAPGLNLSPYTVWMLILMEAAGAVYEPYLAAGMPEEVYWDTFSDFACKAEECRSVHGVYGTFVAHWYPRFFRGEIVKLGRLEYETHPYPGKEPFTLGGYTLQPNEEIFSIHIPSSGEPFDRESRLASYRMAREYFADRLQGGPFVAFCDSWLLYPAYREVFPKGSRIASFAEDFTIVEAVTEPHFSDAWRVFADKAALPAQDLPTNTRLRAAFREYMLHHDAFGEGLGVLILDDEGLRVRSPERKHHA